MIRITRRQASTPSARSRKRWPLYLGLAIALPALALCGILGYYYLSFAKLIDARLHAERERARPRVFARLFELHRGQASTVAQLVDRLNDLGYAQRAIPERPGEFGVGRETLTLVPRTGDFASRPVRLQFGKATPRDPAAVADRIQQLQGPDGRPIDSVTLEAPMLTALITTAREKRRQVLLSLVPPHVIYAVLAIEDHRFYDHLGVDPIRMVGALISNLRGDKPYLIGASTVTQQLVKNFFLTQEKTIRRKLLEQFMALVLERRASKDEILELYLNEVYLGQRGSFAIHGVAEAARLLFAKDVNNLTLSEAALIAGLIQSPFLHSPFASAARARERRNVVLQAMARAGFVSQDASRRAASEPLTVVPRALDAEAPYFVDLVARTLSEQYPGLMRAPQALDVYTTLDLHLQRLAQDAVRDGLARVDEALVAKRLPGPPRRAQAVLIALDPRSGELLALVGGRSYNQSQFNRASNARRQPGSVFKPFVYLAAFERAAADGRTDITPATLVDDEPTSFMVDQGYWTPANYEDAYDGPVTLRRALALSRNVVAVKVAEQAGYDRVADLWKRVGASTAPRPYPAIALGVFEATPMEVAAAFTTFPNLGTLRPLQSIVRIVSDGKEAPLRPPAETVTVARPDTTFLVTNLMRSVINEGTGASVRAAGFTLDAAGKTGTTNDLRDAWFVGFTPSLLAVVWVGLDDNQPLELSGSQAALPIWTQFMLRALAGFPSEAFEAPEGVVFVDIDRDTGLLAAPGCPRVFSEAFLSGTQPTRACDLHTFD